MATTVRSAAGLTEDFAKHFTAAPVADRAYLADSSGHAAVHESAPRRTAIFAIHGISPTQRYAFQDQVATSLRSFLNAMLQVAGKTRDWKSVVHWPRSASGGDSATVRPSALRVYRGSDPEKPAGAVYDVYEGYWSPLSKGKTNIASAMQWLLNSSFLPASSTANIPCSDKKLKSDLGYVIRLMVKGLAVGFAGVLIALAAWTWFVTMLSSGTSHPSFWELLTKPVSAALELPLPGYLLLIVDALAAYAGAQLIVMAKVGADRTRRTGELNADADAKKSQFGDDTLSADKFHRRASLILWIAFVVLVILAIALGASVAGIARFNLIGGLLLAADSALVALSILAFQYARSMADFAVDDVLGDVQIYTTRDDNSTYHDIRQQIVKTVTDALLGVLRAVEDPKNPAEPYYHSVHVFGHSLGSTIAMDVLIALRQMVEECALSLPQWNRIRSLVTFGTSLEKTRFFFDVRQPTISAAQNQWENDVYGRFFTDAMSTFDNPDNAKGIYWTNIWYFQDIVANEIKSYMSDVPAGASFVWENSPSPRNICANHLVPHVRPRDAWVHSDYLGDALFWEKVAPVIAR